MFNFSGFSGAYLCAQRPLALYISQPPLPSAVVLKTLNVNFFISAFTKSDLKVCMCVCVRGGISAMLLFTLLP